MFILNISVEQTKFICNKGSISRRNLTITLSIDIYDSEQYKSFTQALTYTSSGIHLIRKNYLNTNSLNIERGRYTRPKLPRDKRTCKFCNEVETETHFVVYCKTDNTLRDALSKEFDIDKSKLCIYRLLHGHRCVTRHIGP